MATPKTNGMCRMGENVLYVHEEKQVPGTLFGMTPLVIGFVNDRCSPILIT